MKIAIQADTPSDLLRGTLGYLAVNYGGYGKAETFLDLWDELFDPNPRVSANAGEALCNLIERIEGATAAIAQIEAIERQAEEAETSFVEAEPPEDLTDFQGFDFVAPTVGDQLTLENATAGEPFFLFGGPEAMVVRMFDPGNPLGFADFGKGGDVIAALHGKGEGGRVEPKLTVEQRVEALHPLGQIAFTIYAPLIYSLPEDKQHALVDDLERLVAEQLSRCGFSKAA